MLDVILHALKPSLVAVTTTPLRLMDLLRKDAASTANSAAVRTISASLRVQDWRDVAVNLAHSVAVQMIKHPLEDQVIRVAVASTRSTDAARIATLQLVVPTTKAADAILLNLAAARISLWWPKDPISKVADARILLTDAAKMDGLQLKDLNTKDAKLLDSAAVWTESLRRRAPLSMDAMRNRLSAEVIFKTIFSIRY